MGYSFARHETFHIRTGWLRKGLNALKENEHIFLEEDAMEELGIGKNMVSSLRYWLQATGLTKEEYNSRRQKIQKKTDLAKKILKYDKYFEDPATFWILHYNIVKNESKLATTWHWFFNYFNYIKFDQELFIDQLKKFIRRTGEKMPAESSLKKDFNVFTRMYLYDSDDNRSPESSLESPFTDLKLLYKSEDNKYKINNPGSDNLPSDILFYCLLDSIENNNLSINIDHALNNINSVGNIFKLTPTIFYNYLNELEEKEYLRVDKQAGLDSITILEDSKENVLKSYYKNN